MKDTIFDLWYGNINPVEVSGKITPEIKRMLNDSNESYEIILQKPSSRDIPSVLK